MDIKSEILNWLANGEVGMSSKTIAYKMAGIVYNDSYGAHPLDPSDFKRCLKLVNMIPEIRPRLDEMRAVSKYWNALIENWDKLEKCFMDEVGGWLVGKDRDKKATMTFAMMEEIYNI